MSETTWTAATEGKRHWTDEQNGTRVFRISDELAAQALTDWSEPVQLKLEKNANGTWDLVARTPRESE